MRALLLVAMAAGSTGSGVEAGDRAARPCWLAVRTREDEEAAGTMVDGRCGDVTADSGTTMTTRAAEQRGSSRSAPRIRAPPPARRRHSLAGGTAAEYQRREP